MSDVLAITSLLGGLAEKGADLSLGVLVRRPREFRRAETHLDAPGVVVGTLTASCVVASGTVTTHHGLGELDGLSLDGGFDVFDRSYTSESHAHAC